MSDVVTPEKRSRMMSGIRGKNTRPELVVRSGLFASGFRFRLHRRDLPGSPDLVLAKWKAVIFINGCFWHAHPGCRYFRIPKSRRAFWSAKLEGNRARDVAAVTTLIDHGWKVVTVWECALRANISATLEHLETAIRDPRKSVKWEILQSQGQPGIVEMSGPG
jgi:DNA mismatch endonuclease (patch repair protein)